MAVFDLEAFDGHEQVVFSHDPISGLKAIIAVHSTKLGPATGGCRMWNYTTEQDALIDVLRLSKGMTYKNAMADLSMGGGKAVIIGDAKTDKSEALFRAFGRAVEQLNGRYVSAEDVGISPQDIAMAAQETRHVAGLDGKSGDPSPFTANGVFLGMQAALKHQTGNDSLAGKTVAVQGVGHVGYYLCRHLHEAGAKLVVTDINRQSLDRVATEFAAEVVAPDAIYDVAMDIYAPCALGATVNDNTISRIKAGIIAGAANNQLAEARHDKALLERGILYAPDYVINAGGIINCSFEHNYDETASTAKVEKIYDTLTHVFSRAASETAPTGSISDAMAREILANT